MEVNIKKNQILKIAEKLFAEKGFDGTSIRTIAKAAEINIAMISYYFGSKEKLLEEIINDRIVNFKLELENTIATNLNYSEKCDEIVSLIIKRIHKNRHIYKIVNSEFSNGNRKINFDTYNNQKKQNTLLIENFVKSGQDAGVFSKKVNIQLITPTIFGTYFHFYYNKPFFEEQLNLSNALLFDTYVHSTLTTHIQQTIKALLTYEV